MIAFQVDLKSGENKLLLKVVTVQGEAYFTFAPKIGEAESVPAIAKTLSLASARSPVMVSGPRVPMVLPGWAMLSAAAVAVSTGMTRPPVVCLTVPLLISSRVVAARCR